MVTRFVLCVFMAFCALSSFAAVPKRPFPQHQSYAADTLRPNHFTQSQMDQHVRDFYDTWKARFLVAAGSDSAGRPLFRIAFDQGSPVTVSEGQGYGMMITALMAGHDPQAQDLFDGLWRFARRYPSGGDARLMSWRIEDGVVTGGNNSAFDGDADMAYGLLLAHAQWGDAGVVDYGAAARELISAILSATVGPQSKLPTLGDWVGFDGAGHNQWTPRSSDFLPSHFRAFGRFTQEPAWSAVVGACQNAIDSLQAGDSAATGLLSDFMLCGDDLDCRAAPAGFLEGAHDGAFYYNAGRDPWRLALDVLLNGDERSRAQIRPFLDWIVATSGGQAAQIAAGYRLDGSAIGQYATTFFIAPMGVAAMTDARRQVFLNNVYSFVYDRRESYYEDSVNLMCLLAMTGNFWDPTNGDVDPPADLERAYPNADRYHPLPGVIEAEHFNSGPSGLAYVDGDAENQGGALRQTGVDLQPCQDEGGGVNLGWTRAGEWLDYFVTVAAGRYDLVVRVAAQNDGGRLAFDLDGLPLAEVAIAATGGWQQWTTLRVPGINLPADRAGELRLRVLAGGVNVNWFGLVEGEEPPDPSGDCAVAYAVTSDWGSGFVVETTITNHSDSLISGWRLEWTLPAGQSISSSWNVTLAAEGSAVRAGNSANHWNGVIAPGASVRFGFVVNGDSARRPVTFELNGSLCENSD